jgi:hypothetical protein
MIIEELKQMPIVTVEQVLRFREAALSMIEMRERQLIELSELASYCVADVAPDLSCKDCKFSCENKVTQWPE